MLSKIKWACPGGKISENKGNDSRHKKNEPKPQLVQPLVEGFSHDSSLEEDSSLLSDDSESDQKGDFLSGVLVNGKSKFYGSIQTHPIKRRKILDRLKEKELCCWNPDLQKFHQWPIWLDLIQDHTKNRFRSVFLVVLFLSIVIHLSYLLSINLDTDNDDLGSTIGGYIAVWIQWIELATAAVIFGSVFFIGMDVKQHPCMEVVSFLGVLLLCLYLLYLSNHINLADEFFPLLGQLNHALQWIIVVANVVTGVITIVLTLYHKGRLDFYNTKRENYTRLVTHLLTKQDQSVTIHNTLFQNCLQKTQSYLPSKVKRFFTLFYGAPKNRKPESETIHEQFFQKFEYFFFPQRLLVSSVICVMFCLIFFTLVILTTQDVGKLLFWIPLLTSNETQIIEEILTRKINFTTENIGAEIAWVIAAIMATTISCTNLYILMKNYRRKIFEMRLGRQQYNKIYPVWQATRYIGYQISHTIFGWFLIFIFSFLLEIFFQICYYSDWMWNNVLQFFLPTMIVYLSISIPMKLLYVCLITKHKGRVIKYKPVFQLVDYLNIFLQVISGTLVALTRLAIFFLILSFNFARIDYSMYPHEWFTWDDAYTAFIGMLVLDHQYNNPILLVFSYKFFEKISQRNSERKSLGGNHQENISEEFTEEISQRNSARKSLGGNHQENISEEFSEEISQRNSVRKSLGGNHQENISEKFSEEISQRNSVRKSLGGNHQEKMLEDFSEKISTRNSERKSLSPETWDDPSMKARRKLSMAVSLALLLRKNPALRKFRKNYLSLQQQKWLLDVEVAQGELEKESLSETAQKTFLKKWKKFKHVL